MTQTETFTALAAVAGWETTYTNFDTETGLHLVTVNKAGRFMWVGFDSANGNLGWVATNVNTDGATSLLQQMMMVLAS